MALLAWPSRIATSRFGRTQDRQLSSSACEVGGWDVSVGNGPVLAW